MATHVTRKLKEPTKAERASLYERWIAKVKLPKGGLHGRGCWKWTGAKSLKRNGKRGVIRVGGKDGRIMSAARVGKILATGAKFNDPKLAALEICHERCGNGGNDTDCVNPHHTVWGTRQDNEDHKRRGR